MFRSTIKRGLRDPYVLFCAGALAVWLVAWLVSFHNLYGWLVDDQVTFYRYQTYAQGGENLIDIEWFHAYMWFLMLPALVFHWSVPSHLAARAYADTPQFRALILYTIILHGVVLALLAAFVRQLCANRFVAGATFLLILTSPTLALYTPFLDSRYLSLLAVLPALMLMLHGVRVGFEGTRKKMLFCFLPGFLFGVGEDIHYECLYLVVLFSIVYWAMLLGVNRKDRLYWAAFTTFVAGVCAWVIPVQLLTMLLHPFGSTYVGILLAQYFRQIPPYSRLENIDTWWRAFSSEMGVPMIVASAAGYVLLAFDRLRPRYVRKFDALVVVGSSLLFSLYLFESRTFPFYRMTFCYQFFYAFAACIFAEQVGRRLASHAVIRVAAGATIILVVSIVPTFLRTPQVYIAQQGYGAAVNTAYTDAGDGNVLFIDTFGMDGIATRAEFNDMPSRADVVTYYPVTFHFKYPDLFALLDSVKPIASYPTDWCTREMWAQVPNFYGGRDFEDEPANCETRVYRVADIKRAQERPILNVVSVRADSSAGRAMGPRRVEAKRNPVADWFGGDQWNVYWDLWVSGNTPGKHWVEIGFKEPARISELTLVPAEFRIPPDFLWHGRKRVSNIAVVANLPDGDAKTVWTGSNLERKVIISARFPAVVASSIRIELWQVPSGTNNRVALKYVGFPEYSVHTSWDNIDSPGEPSPGH